MQIINAELNIVGTGVLDGPQRLILFFERKIYNEKRFHPTGI